MLKKEINHLQKKENGRVYTPDFIVKNILDLSGYYSSNIIRKHVIDNSCGDGAFLCEIVKRYCEYAVSLNISNDSISKELSEFIHGIEIDETEKNKCIENLNDIVRQFGINYVNWDIVCADALTVEKYNGKMDFVLGNPPYIRVHNLGKTYDEIKQFSFAQNGMTDLYIVFYEVGLKMLNKTGVLGYITPSSFFNSVAGKFLRKEIVDHNLLFRIVNLRHFQAFDATTYTTITVLKKGRQDHYVEYYQFDEKNRIPYYVDDLLPKDYYILNNFYFAKKTELELLKKIFYNLGHCDVAVKNGFATLCDNVFIYNFNFKSPHIIPVIKASTGAIKRIFYPYNENAQLLSEKEIQKDSDLYSYLISHKNELVKRSSEKNNNAYWYSFGRSQALKDTYRNKLAINTLLRTKDDWKIGFAPKGTGVYSGLYITSDTVDMQIIKQALLCDEFILYITLLGKYKSGGYYTFSSKDIKAFLDYKLAYNGGIIA